MNTEIMPDQLDIAEKVLLDAADRIRAAHTEHGHTYRSFSLAAELWTSYIVHIFTRRNDTKLKPHDIAQMLGMLKQARGVYGYSGDNFVDQVGYTSLAAMLQHPPTEEEEHQLPVDSVSVEKNLRKTEIAPNELNT